MRALREADVDLRFVGRGGPQMKAVACENCQNWIEKSGVLGLWEVIKHYGYFRKQFHETLREIKASKPVATPAITNARGQSKRSMSAPKTTTVLAFPTSAAAVTRLFAQALP